MRWRLIRGIVAAFLAVLGLTVLGAEIYRYAHIFTGLGAPSLQPAYAGDFDAGICWFWLLYTQDSAGITIRRTAGSSRPATSVLFAIDWPALTVKVWKQPLGFSFDMPPLVYPILLLPYPVLVFVRFVRKRSGRPRFPAGACQQCGYDLAGNVSGTCPECGAAAVADAPPLSLTRQIRLLPWRKIGVVLLVVVVAFAAWYGVRQYRAAVMRRVNPAAAPLAEFQRLLPMVAHGEIRDQGEIRAVFTLAEEHPQVRLWITKTFATLPLEEQVSLILWMLQSASTQTYREFVPVVQWAINSPDHDVAGLRLLRYYVVPQRREILERFIRETTYARRHERRAALRAFLALYGADGIEADLEQALQGKDRDGIAGMIVANVSGPWRQRALRVLHTYLEEEPWSSSAFYELVRNEACGDDELLQQGQQYLQSAVTPDGDIVQQYVDLCSR